MKYPVLAYSRLLGAVALSTLLAACGSGSGGSSSSAPVVPSDVFRITCKVVESVNSVEVPVEGAEVIFYGTDNSKPAYTDTTLADGSCAVDVPSAEVQVAGTALTFPAASVVKAGYEPNSIVCDRATAGTSCDAKVVMVRLPANASIPENGDVVRHIGDDNFAGEPNSKFQRDAEGPSIDFNIADWATKLNTRATVVLEARGWQTTTATCANTVAILSNVVGGGSQSQAGADSDASGDWSERRFTFDTAQVGSAGAATLRITSGKCAGTGDLDDFEVNRIRVYFCGATGVDCAP